MRKFRMLSGMIFAGVVAVGLAGCNGNYRRIPLLDVKMVDTEAGRKPVIEAENYIAFREVVERSGNVKSATRMTDLKSERQPSFFAVAPTAAMSTSSPIAGSTGTSGGWRWSRRRSRRDGPAGVRKPRLCVVNHVA